MSLFNFASIADQATRDALQAVMNSIPTSLPILGKSWDLQKRMIPYTYNRNYTSGSPTSPPTRWNIEGGDLSGGHVIELSTITAVAEFIQRAPRAVCTSLHVKVFAGDLCKGSNLKIYLATVRRTDTTTAPTAIIVGGHPTAVVGRVGAPSDKGFAPTFETDLILDQYGVGAQLAPDIGYARPPKVQIFVETRGMNSFPNDGQVYEAWSVRLEMMIEIMNT